MKTVFDAVRFATCPRNGWLICLALLACITAGCGRSGTSAPATPPSTTTSASSDSRPQTAIPQQAATNSDVPKEEMQAMNRALLGWMRANNRRPKTFEEFASSTDYQIPTPPPGKKYAFSSRGFIVLVNDTSH